jgi:F0F1-type ATP synthase assembly protein I
MAAAKQKNSDKKEGPSDKEMRSMAVLLFATAADTTWRMFVPALGGALLGLWADSALNTEPVFAVGGLIVGVGITALLIRQQYRKVDIDAE